MKTRSAVWQSESVALGRRDGAAKVARSALHQGYKSRQSGIAAILRSGPLILMPGFSCPVYSRKLSFEIQKRADGRDRRRSSRRAVEPADCSLSSLNSHPADAEPRSRRRVCRAAAVWGLDWPVRRSELRCRGLATSTPARRSASLAASSRSSSTCSTAAVFARDPGPGAYCGACSGYRGLMRDICGRRPAVPAASHAATWQRGS